MISLWTASVHHLFLVLLVATGFIDDVWDDICGDGALLLMILVIDTWISYFIVLS